jgi:hypothetical protein
MLLSDVDEAKTAELSSFDKVELFSDTTPEKVTVLLIDSEVEDESALDTDVIKAVFSDSEVVTVSDAMPENTNKLE